MLKNNKNETASSKVAEIKKKHRKLVSTAVITILFLVIIPLLLVAFITEVNRFFFFLAWGHIFLLFILAWGVGIWHYFFIRSLEQSRDNRGERP
ncbi:hypothetical protein SH601_16445 [Gracilibacillus sp. S3-1-1]|uniref:Uncharacterized protein n=1 Tax=Gracilibacillus pellucidus TaxID=3095368 RepID=A0ACC6M9M0_9BACI|nr:hypothetical protein [Gracilibacillus sp. S3-1-1]MDX8047557.1 hypothetical protein [Gracilibacillus sp. S3-1-1]